MEKNIFICPRCKSNLLRETDHYKCVSCVSEWRIENEVPIFLKRSLYWGEISKDKMLCLNKVSSDTNWKVAIQAFLSKEKQEFILNNKRINWKYFVNSDINSTILDVGSGWGTLSFELAKNCGMVYAFEPVYERVQFIQIRKTQDGAKNVIPVCGNALELPFPDEYFDIVILNGVLEWIGLYDLTAKANKVQEKALRGLFRVLKPGGSIYIGIENRTAFFYFLGTKDPHSGLCFVTLMPRAIASFYSKLARGKDYREYTYSYNGYKKILNKAGFRRINFYVPIPSYLNFKYIIPLDSPRAIRYWLSNIIYHSFTNRTFSIKFLFLILKIVCNTSFVRMVKYFVPDFSIVAVKE